MNNKNQLSVKFGTLIRTTRINLNIGLREFAKIIGISATYISKMEVGDYAPPSEERIKKMAETLKLDKDELLAMAGKISSDLQEIIASQPKLYASFLRRAKKQDIKGYLKENGGDQ